MFFPKAFIKTSVSFCILCQPLLLLAQTYQVPTLKVLGDRESFEEPGAIHRVGQENLSRKQSVDPHEVLQEVSGVYIQQEDAFGLRPNIGLRGAHPHRSRKVTLLEDRVLVAPAPYSAPAAYYFPLMSRIVDMEIYKGPSSVKYGPNSIGGAINFVTRDFSNPPNSQLNYSYGFYQTHKMGLWNSGEFKKWQWLLELNRWQSEGFKELPSNKKTGFYRNDTLLKTRYNLSESHIFDFKFNWANEKSNETYLGLAAQDFNSNPYQRYSASNNDFMKWNYLQYQARHFWQFNDDWLLQTTLYSHHFARLWDKFNGFEDSSIDVSNVLDDPNAATNQNFYNVLKGTQNSTSSETIEYGANDRVYWSGGLQWEGTWTPVSTENKEHQLEFGVLLHQDEIERRHRFHFYNMQEGALVDTNTDTTDSNNQNKDTSDALRLFAVQNHKINSWLLRAGVRYENVKAGRKNNIDGTREDRRDTAIIPGAGVSFEFAPHHILFIGANKGMTLPGPGQLASVKKEESWNYELGYRHKKQVAFEAIAFLSDYKNILGTCSFSSGCSSSELDQQFNGGRAEILGAELNFGVIGQYKSYDLPFRWTATYTQAQFKNSIQSSNEQWGSGTIQSGDPMPYIPEWKTTLSTGLQRKSWSIYIDYNWQSEMFDQAVASNRKSISGYSTWDASITWTPKPKRQFFMKIKNILDKEYLVSFRPFGARPGSPRWISAGAQFDF